MNLEKANILCMINARGGSKGIPGKNKRQLMGQPLIAWSIAVAKNARFISRTIVSTEDEEIAQIARDHGADVPFMRPAELASDASVQFDTIKYNLDRLELEHATQFDAVVLLQPTSPLRTVGDVEGCIALMAESGGDTVITIAELNHFHPKGIWHKCDDEARLEPYEPIEPTGFNRQTNAPLYWRTGAVYVIKRDVIVNKQAIYGDDVRGYLVNEPRSWFNLDSEFDWQLTEAWLKHMKLGTNSNT